MATVNFSVRDEVKEAFDAAFSGQNKGAVIARLMTRAVEEQALQARRAELHHRLTARRQAAASHVGQAVERADHWPAVTLLCSSSMPA